MTASKIEWTDRSDWNPVRGCTRVSEGCRHCYAEAIAARFSGAGQPFDGFATRQGGEARWTGKVALVENRLTLPLRWKKPARIFASSTSDIFHESLADAEQPWWIAVDISSILGYRDAPNMVRMLDSDQSATHSVSSSSQNREMLVVTEGGMLTCVIRSKRPEAKRFLRWITDEVLPSIFRTGSYTLPGHQPPEQFAESAICYATLDPARVAAAISLVRQAQRLYGVRAARTVWVSLRLPDCAPATPAIDDGLATALATWIADKDRLTYSEIGHGLGIGDPDRPARRRLADILTGMGWTWKNTKIAGQQIWTWHRPAVEGESVQ